MTVAPIGGSSPTFISGPFARPYTLRNAGDKSIYLGTDSSVTAYSRAITLVRGATMQWSGDTELWALCEAGETSTLEWIYEGASSVTDGATYTEIAGDVNLAPGSTVGVDGVVEVVGDVNISGGSVALSGPVVIDGDVNVSGSTINVGNTVDSRGVSDWTLLGSVTLNVTGAGTFPFTNTSYDVSSYNSLLFTVESLNAPTLPVIGSYIYSGIGYYEVSGTLPAAEFTPQWLVNRRSNVANSIQIPVLGQQLRPNMGVVETRAVSYQITLKIYGGSEVLSTPRYVSTGIGFEGTLNSGGVYYLLANTTSDVFIKTSNNPLTVVLQKAAATTTAYYNLYACESGTLRYVSGDAINTAMAVGEVKTLNRSFPYLPIRLSTTVTAGQVQIGIA